MSLTWKELFGYVGRLAGGLKEFRFWQIGLVGGKFVGSKKGEFEEFLRRSSGMKLDKQVDGLRPGAGKKTQQQFGNQVPERRAKPVVRNLMANDQCAPERTKQSSGDLRSGLRSSSLAVKNVKSQPKENKESDCPNPSRRASSVLKNCCGTKPYIPSGQEKRYHG